MTSKDQLKLKQDFSSLKVVALFYKIILQNSLFVLALYISTAAQQGNRTFCTKIIHLVQGICRFTELNLRL